MGLPIQNLRSGTSSKRPNPTGLENGQIAINYHEDDPAIFIRGESDALIKVAPTFVGTPQPNSSPATGGSTGNSKGETWLDTTLTPPTFKVYDGSNWVTAFGYSDIDISGRYTQTVQTVSALDIDCSAGNYFTKTINANSTFTFSNVPTNRAYAFTLELRHTSGTITWPSSVKFTDGVTPSLSTGKDHLFVFITDDGGSCFRAGLLRNYTY